MQAIWDDPHQTLTLLVLVLTLLVILLSAIMIFTRTGGRAKIRRSGAAFLTAPDQSVVELVGRQLDSLASTLVSTEARLGKVEQAVSNAVTRVGLVRFNAFQDTGSDLSFSLALLDAQYHGVVLTSLYGRDEGRVYAKAITGGASAHPLSTEEKQALAAARGGNGR